jgi:hypothetical protein
VVLTPVVAGNVVVFGGVEGRRRGDAIGNRITEALKEDEATESRDLAGLRNLPGLGLLNQCAQCAHGVSESVVLMAVVAGDVAVFGRVEGRRGGVMGN